MRSYIPFDTHAFVKKLVAVGVPEPQVEVHAQMLGEIVIERLATKDDLAMLREEMRSDMSALELRLTLRVGAMLAAAVAVMAVLVKPL